MSNTLATTPVLVPFATTDVRTLAMDFTAVLLITGGSLSSPTIVIWDVTNGVNPLVPVVVTNHGTSPIIIGNLVDFQILGSDLIATHTYRVTITVEIGAQTFTAYCTLLCQQ